MDEISGPNVHGEVQETSSKTSLASDRTFGSAEDIAVIGMSCRLPGAESLEEFWNVLQSGQDFHQKLPANRFDVDNHHPGSGEIPEITNLPTYYGCFLDRPGLFDPRLFNISPREAKQIDPTQRLLMMTTYEALEMAGYSDSVDGRLVGTFFGQTTDDWRECNAAKDIDMYYISGGLRPFGPGRLNYYFKWEGPSYSIDTACSSSSAAVQLACTALATRECNLAVAGGGNIMTGVQMFEGLSRGRFLSPSGSCKTFDDGADGYCRGEGVGAIVLKRFEDAIKDHDNIQGVIKSISTNHSVYASSITQPHAGAQERLYEQVLQKAGLRPSQITYIEAHGTGTQQGDRTEVESLTKTFGQDRAPNNPLYIGSVKPNVGHGEAAAGVTSLIKAMMVLQKRTLPPHIGIKKAINRNFAGIETNNIRIPRVLTDVGPSQHPKPMKILLSNFNAAGGNTCMILEEHFQSVRCHLDPRSTHPVVLSAKTPGSLYRNAQRLLDFLVSNPETNLANLSYTTTARRIHHTFRSAYAASSKQELMEAVARSINDSKLPCRNINPPSVVFVMTGQGSQYSGMGRELFETCGRFRDSLEHFEDISLRLGFPPFLFIVRDDKLDLSTLSPVQLQLGLVSLELALADLWQSWGLKPDLVIGHSVGEYVALCVAGVFSVSDLLLLIGKRAELQQKTCTSQSHAMLAVQCSVATAEHLLATQFASCGISCINSPSSIVLNGTSNDITAMREYLHRSGIKTARLPTPFAFHSPQMDSMLAEFQTLAKTVKYFKPIIPVASSLTTEIVRTEGVFDASYLSRQTRQPVNFLGALKACQSHGICDDQTLWVECGPAPVCIKFADATIGVAPTKTIPSLKINEHSWKSVSTGLAQAYKGGADISWSAYHEEFLDVLTLLDLPRYAFDLEDFWLPSTAKRVPQDRSKPDPPPSLQPFSTTCLQHVTSETYDEEKVSVTFVSSLNEPALYGAISGHSIEGIGLCPSSVYTDMALTAASYIHSKLSPSSSKPVMDITAMEISKPLVVRSQESSQQITILAIRPLYSDSTTVSFTSKDGSIKQDHGHCTVNLADETTWRDEWKDGAHIVRDRRDRLSNPEISATHIIPKCMIYRLFSTLVVYHKNYQCLDTVLMDWERREASATVRFPESTFGGTFTINPYWIDSIIHLPGFILNCNAAAPDNMVYISTGWQSLRIVNGLKANKGYTSYARMHESKDRGLITGDISVSDGHNIVAVCAGVTFRALAKSTLRSLLLGPHETSAPSPYGHVYKARSSSEGLEAPSSRIGMETQLKWPLGTNRTSKRKCSPALLQPPLSKKNKTDTPSHEPNFQEILRLIATELNVNIKELEDEVNFSQLGMDSLLNITIISELDEQMQLKLPASIFSMCPSVAQLREFVNGQPASWNNLTGVTVSEDAVPSTSEQPLSSRCSSIDPASSMDGTTAGAILISAIIDETGLNPECIEPSTRFTDLGVDSLLTINIINRVMDQTGSVVPTSFFISHPTIADAVKALEISKPSSLSTDKTPRSSRIVFLQGDPNSKSPPLFLIADGAGSAASYIHLPPLSSKIPVYALESPFLQCPLEYNYSFEAVAEVYVSAIRSVQAQGPYLLGGWSLGGMHAYEVSRQLISQGQRVQGLLMIDSPCPRPLPEMPEPTVELLEQTGVFMGSKLGTSVERPMKMETKTHLVACVRALKSYNPVPMGDTGRPDRCCILWARFGMFETMGTAIVSASRERNSGRSEDRVKEHDDRLGKDWLTAQRRSFGPNGWERLLGEVECHIVDGDHFSIMNQPLIRVTGELVDKTVEKFLE